MKHSSANEKRMKSDLMLTKCAIILLSVISIVLMAGGPFCVRWVMRRPSPLFEGEVRYWLMLIGGYVCGALLLYCLYILMKLLKNLEAGAVFVKENVGLLKRVSVIILIASLISLFLGLTCIPSMAAVAVIAAFMALIVRVVRDAFARAVEMQDELDYTI